MNELKFIMTTKLIEKYNDRMREFFEVIQEYVEKVHDGKFTGITEISYAGINYTWKKLQGVVDIIPQSTKVRMLTIQQY